MKGVIVVALKEMVEQKYGKAKWKIALERAGIKEDLKILPTSNVDDNLVLQVLKALTYTLNTSLPELGDLFGDYWINVFAQKYYRAFFKAKDAKEFLLKMDEVHTAMTFNLKDASPPRFEYQWKDENTIIMKYISKRKLIDFMIGLIKGVGKYYREPLKVEKISDSEVRIVFDK